MTNLSTNYSQSRVYTIPSEVDGSSVFLSISGKRDWPLN